jgi:hypothetical protein
VGTSVNSQPVPSAPESNSPVFHERRTVPWSWWIIGPAIAVPTTEAIVVLGPQMSHKATAAFALGCLGVTLVLVGAVLLLLGRSDVRVDSSGLRAGSAVLLPGHVGRARTLDPAAARRLLGPGIRADAHLSLRPWIKSAVQIEVEQDPSTPYWVVATRRPQALVDALDVIRGAALQQEPTGQGGKEEDSLDRKADR